MLLWLAWLTIAATPAVEARVSTSLPGRDQSRPEAAVDGDPATAFQARRPATEADDWTIRFTPPIALHGVDALTGPDAAQAAGGGRLEVSNDGKTFRDLATLADGRAHAALDAATPVAALRLRPEANQEGGLSLRELTLTPRPENLLVTVEPRVTMDSHATPDLAQWGTHARELAEEWGPKLARLLASPGFQPPPQIELYLDPNSPHIAYAAGNAIHIAAPYVRDHRDDWGMIIHELTHVYQSYPDGNPGWLVEGLADHVRLFQFEPDAPRPRIDPERASFRDAYKTTAVFLEWVRQRYDPDLIPHLNRAMREGTYQPGTFVVWTGAPVEQLWREFTATLPRLRRR